MTERIAIEDKKCSGANGTIKPPIVVRVEQEKLWGDLYNSTQTVIICPYYASGYCTHGSVYPTSEVQHDILNGGYGQASKTLPYCILKS